MKNIKTDFELNEAALEQDLQELTPLFDDIVSNRKLGTPPTNIIENIYSEASAYTLRRKFQHRLHRALRSVAAVAAIFLVVAGGIRINSVQQNNRRIEVINQLCIASDTALESDQSLESSNAALADLLMEMQGFDEETWFAMN